MSKVIVAGSAGFCFGVSRSVKMADELLKQGPCLSLGPLIHNEDVVRSLSERGLTVISSPEPPTGTKPRARSRPSTA